MSKYFPEPKSLGGRMKVILDLYNYATKADLKSATCVDTSTFPKKICIMPRSKILKIKYLILLT